MMRFILLLWISQSIITNQVHGWGFWCEKHFEGFSLEDDYNRNSPPIPPRVVEGKFKKFVLNTQTTLWDIDEVSYFHFPLSLFSFQRLYFNQHDVVR